jgi:hypothetical protein
MPVPLSKGFNQLGGPGFGEVKLGIDRIYYVVFGEDHDFGSCGEEFGVFSLYQQRKLLFKNDFVKKLNGLLAIDSKYGV